MSYIGPVRDLASLVGGLNAETLPRLVRDLLASQGHDQIRITDGPGDGCRDLHSLGPGKVPWLTQCKYHQSVSTAVTSRELAELAIGLVKFGAKDGLFVTTAKISPQAKREFLGDYPGLSLDFLDGGDLLAAVLDNVALTALWFDGERLAPVNTAITVPVILRDLVDDVPLALVPVWDSTSIVSLSLGIENVDIDLRFPVFESASRFEPYRAPRRRTLTEGMSADLACAELIVTGVDGLSSVSKVLRAVAERMISDSASQHSTLPLVALRLGRPALTPLRGTSAGSRTMIANIRPLTLVRRSEHVFEEHASLVPTSTSEWVEKSMARTSQINAVRLYNERLDACAALEILTPPGEYFRWMQWAREERLRHAWGMSVFVLHAADTDPEVIHSAAPDDKIQWADGRVLYGWFQEYLLSNMDAMPIRHSDLAAYVKSEDERDARELARLSVIRDAHARTGEIVSPAKARHMVAVVGSDPTPETKRLHLRTADVLTPDDSEIPSPVDPRSVSMRATMCWTLTGHCPTVDASSLPKSAVVLREIWEDEVDGSRFLIAHFDESEDLGLHSVEDRMARLSSGLAVAAEYLERTVGTCIDSRATADYWMKRFIIDCRGTLPVPDPDNKNDWPGPPAASTREYLDLMDEILGTRL